MNFMTKETRNLRKLESKIHQTCKLERIPYRLMETLMETVFKLTRRITKRRSPVLIQLPHLEYSSHQEKQL
jgi:hypothetical protein